MKIHNIKWLSLMLQGVVLSGLISVGIVGVMGSDGISILTAFYCATAVLLILLSLIQLFVRRAP